MKCDRGSKRQIACLVRQAQKGEGAAFSKLYQLYYSEICYYLQLHLKDGALCAEDIAQETFLQVFKKIEQVKDPGSFTSWVYQTAHRTLLNVMRSEGRHNIMATETFEGQEGLIADYSQLPEDLAETHEQCDLVRDCLNQLDESQRSVLLLRYEAGLNATEIANILGRSSGTVRNQLVAARRELKVELQQRSVTLGGAIPAAVILAKNSALSHVLQADVARHFSTPSAEQAKSFVARSLPQIPAGPSAAQAISSGAQVASTQVQTIGTRVAVGLGALLIVAGAGTGAYLLAPSRPAPVKAKEIAAAPLEATPAPKESAQSIAATPTVAPAEVAVQENEKPAPQVAPVSNVTPAPAPVPASAPVAVTAPAVAASPIPPVITFARQHISTSIGAVLTPAQILSATGAQAVDSNNQPVPVSLVGYNVSDFSQAGSYAFSVIARDSQGVKAKSVAVFVDVQ